eukprot:7857987-Alexandrium_andersonii.AAC.1
MGRLRHHPHVIACVAAMSACEGVAGGRPPRPGCAPCRACSTVAGRPTWICRTPCRARASTAAASLAMLL